MSVRPFDWRDLPFLHQHRHESIFLDSALLLTRGPLLIPGALLSYLAPSVGVLTSVAYRDQGQHQTLIGQFIHVSGSPYAHLTFLSPEAALESPLITELLDSMIGLSGERGAYRLLADVDERSEAYESLRRSGFAIYTRQRIWQLGASLNQQAQSKNWRPALRQDAIAIRVLYNNLVPGLVQQVEPYVAQRPQGVVYYQKGELLAYIELKYGHRGIWAQPFIHPDAEEVAEFLADLLGKIPGRLSRPVYICLRSYQSWLESAIEELGAQAGPRQAVMVKHLAIQQKAARPLTLPALEAGHPEATVPFAH
ncbi:MAG: hypothetical protein JXB15_11515 [Anaerolineales bacterium]|nr:hypothetical protein [Anaerolineales bacterium]